MILGRAVLSPRSAVGLPVLWMRVTVMVSVPPVSCHSNSLPPPSGSDGLGAASGTSVLVNSTR